MRSSIKKWGNSASVRIPASVIQAAHFTLDQNVDVREEDGRVIIEPLPALALDVLLDQITAENLHDPVDFGPPKGREIW